MDIEIENPAKGSLILKIVLGPAQEEYAKYRQAMLNIAKEHKTIFKLRGEKASKWNYIDTIKIIDSPEERYGEDGSDDFDNKIWKKIEKYLKDEMPKKVELLLQAFKEENADGV
ncbi:MAG: hypothetical protein J6Z36_02865 [Clostridia bacterium]|nr:hypothetical protein [Clostridia bacterium]